MNRFRCICDIRSGIIGRFLRDESGASAAEYALILAIVTTGIAGATITLSNAIGTAINEAANCIADKGVNAGCGNAAAATTTP